MPTSQPLAKEGPHPEQISNPEFRKKLLTALENASEEKKGELKDTLYEYLKKASVTEQLLSLQYLYSAFSLKKFPEEFDDYKKGDKHTDEKRLAEIEIIRRWEASILYVARQEMEHLAMVQNLIAILGYDPYFYRPNFPVSADEVILDKPLNLMPFSLHAAEIFRYWEKPDRLHLPDPFRLKVPPAIKAMAAATPHPKKAKLFDQAITNENAWAQIYNILAGNDSAVEGLDTIEELYAFISVFFYFLIEYKIIECSNYNRIVNEHFGFNMSLDPIVDGKYYQYVQAVIQQIIQEGEGVWGVPPPLDSHFMVFQTIISGLNEKAADFKPALPCVWNPVSLPVPNFHSAPLPAQAGIENSPVFVITNEVAIAAMNLFNEAYKVLVQMLYGFFKSYSVNNTTGLHPPHINAFFQTAYYPFMTMVIRPLGELVCRLPAEKDYVPEDGRVPAKTAGPDFFFAINKQPGSTEIENYFSEMDTMEEFTAVFKNMSQQATDLGFLCAAKGYHVANYREKDARDFNIRFQYLGENLFRIAQNFEAYWNGKIVAPIPSDGFQNFSEQYN